MSPKTGDPYHGELSIEEKHGISEGSQAHEAEALLKGQQHEDSNRSLEGTVRSGDSATDVVTPEVGGSDTARLQQMREVFSVEMSWNLRADRYVYIGDERRAVDCGSHYSACDIAAEHIKSLQRLRDIVIAALDAQALALRTVQQERDEAREQYNDLVDEAAEQFASLRADVARLTGERDIRQKAISQQNDLIANLHFDVSQAKSSAEHAEQHVLALREGIEHLITMWTARAEDFIAAKPSVGASTAAGWIGKCTDELRSALLAAIKET